VWLAGLLLGHLLSLSPSRLHALHPRTPCRTAKSCPPTHRPMCTARKGQVYTRRPPSLIVARVSGVAAGLRPMTNSRCLVCPVGSPHKNTCPREYGCLTNFDYMPQIKSQSVHAYCLLQMLTGGGRGGGEGGGCNGAYMKPDPASTADVIQQHHQPM